ncbi:hypothetical protein OS493_019950 [Desmophyllum pertusum]|uniref:Uncharacterized protein n=1 Tax=Desmophyllum pertusum TaxID=174260 RepID=A0A9W9YNC4_9CNID|nr:hypothetical protein OS493_019950 [Desmophyllum pertusum]
MAKRSSTSKQCIINFNKIRDRRYGFKRKKEGNKPVGSNNQEAVGFFKHFTKVNNQEKQTNLPFGTKKHSKKEIHIHQQQQSVQGKKNVWGTKRQERKRPLFRTEQDEEDEDDTSKDEHEEYDEEET